MAKREKKAKDVKVTEDCADDEICLERLDPDPVEVPRGTDDTFFAIIGANLNLVVDDPENDSKIFVVDEHGNEVPGITIRIDSRPSSKRINAIANADPGIPDDLADIPLAVAVMLGGDVQCDAQGTLIIR